MVKLPPVVVESVRDLMAHNGSHPAIIQVERELRVKHVALCKSKRYEGNIGNGCQIKY